MVVDEKENGALTRLPCYTQAIGVSFTMPEISRFLGIVITMYFDDHEPPHFHVRYNEYRALVAISSLNVIEGQLPARVRSLVTEWAELHQDELQDIWITNQFRKIAPLV